MSKSHFDRRKKNSTTYDSFFTYPFKTLSARILIQESPLQASHKPTQQLCSDCLGCFFSLFQCVVLLLVPRAISHTQARTYTRSHALTHIFPRTSCSQSISAQSIQIPEQLCLAFILCYLRVQESHSQKKSEKIPALI